jgi:hypothetical protein
MGYFAMTVDMKDLVSYMGMVIFLVRYFLL